MFPDSNRSQPFGSGATCFYPHGDLMIQNNTEYTYQLLVSVGDEFLEGEWRISSKPKYKFQVIEKNHEMKGEQPPLNNDDYDDEQSRDSPCARVD